MKKLWVIGSINMDLVAECGRFVEPGETLIGTGVSEFPGGKGANQAVALARLGARPLMVGRLGDDPYGRRYLDIFASEGVDASFVAVAGEYPTGLALIEVAADGENRILVIPGANGGADATLVDRALSAVSEGDIALLQLELPLPTVFRAVRGLHARGATIVLDPAPAAPIPLDLLPLIDYLTPNEMEARALAGGAFPAGHDRDAAASLVAAGIGAVILKCGAQGSYIVTAGGTEHISPYAVDAVDTTGAGDSFNAGFAFALARGDSLRDAADFANAVGALSTMAKGAQAAMPTLEAAETIRSRSASHR
jgi:ribokinase